MVKAICISCSILIFTVISCSAVNAQKNHSAYIELLGNGLVYSLNYEYRFPAQEKKWGAKLGIAPLGKIMYTIVQGNYLIGKEKHFFELGLGATVLTGFGSEAGNNQIAPSGALQYRYQGEKGFLFRIGVAPTFLKVDPDDAYSSLARIFWVWPGASVGYTF